MPTIGLPPIAAAFPWMNLVWVLVGITVFLFAVAGVGRWLAATHPDAPAKPVAPAATPVAAPAQADAVTAAIAAAVYVTLGASAKVTSVTPVPPAVSVENLMLTWSLEGRRQIYTSHKVR
jgi:flagellar basal body-associated protein FliL